MARDRRRAKQRRERQGRSGGASARHAGGGALPEENVLHRHEGSDLASGEVDLADAQLAVGRPELSADRGIATGEADAAEAAFGGGEDRRAAAGGGGDDRGRGGDLAQVGERDPEPKRKQGGRLITFLRGSWRELQRVQWPDRRHVAQATAVVIGFVLLAGVFLGAADWLSSRIVDLIV